MMWVPRQDTLRCTWVGRWSSSGAGPGVRASWEAGTLGGAQRQRNGAGQDTVERHVGEGGLQTPPTGEVLVWSHLRRVPAVSGPT